MEIRNFLCTWRASWEEVAEIGRKYVGLWSPVSGEPPFMASPRTPPAIGFRLKSGRYLPAAQATTYLDVPARRRVLEALTATAKVTLCTALEVYTEV